MKKLLLLLISFAAFNIGTIEAQAEKKEDKKVVIKKKMKSSDKKVIKTTKDGDEKVIKVEVEARDEDGDGKNVYMIKVDENGEQKVLEWNGEGEMPEEMKKYMDEKGMEIHIDHDGGDWEEDEDVRVWVDNMTREREIKSYPEVKVRMGVQLNTRRSVLEIEDVQEDSPASKAGLKEGDLLTEINGFHISGYSGLMEMLADHKAGDTIEVRFIRDGKAQTASLTLIAKEEE